MAEFDRVGDDLALGVCIDKLEAAVGVQLQVQQAKLSTIRDANEFALTESGAVLLLQGQSSTAGERRGRTRFLASKLLGVYGSNKLRIDYQGMG
jgi:hypothetical protein